MRGEMSKNMIEKRLVNQPNVGAVPEKGGRQYCKLVTKKGSPEFTLEGQAWN